VAPTFEINQTQSKRSKSLISQASAADASAKLSIYFPAGGGGIEISGAFRSGTGGAATRIFSMNSETFFLAAPGEKMSRN
jgi:hypothetical protein